MRGGEFFRTVGPAMTGRSVSRARRRRFWPCGEMTRRPSLSCRMYLRRHYCRMNEERPAFRTLVES